MGFMMEPLTDEQIAELVAVASKKAPLGSRNAAYRIVKAVERYHGIDASISYCPMCNKPTSDPPCSMNSDGAFHIDHPHNPGRRTPRLFRFKDGN